MSNAGRWIKKHPWETVGIAATLATGGAAAGLFGAAGAAGAGAGIGGANVGAGALTAAQMAALGGAGTAGAAGAAGATGAGAGLLAEGLGAGAAGDMLSAVPATLGDQAATVLGNATYGGNLDKAYNYLKMGNMASGLLSQETPQQPMAPMQIPRTQPLASQPLYGDQAGGLYDTPYDQERRRQMALMMQQGGYRG